MHDQYPIRVESKRSARAVKPPRAFEDILAVRAERQQLVTDFLSTATPELPAEERHNPWGGGNWHEWAVVQRVGG